MKWSGSNAFDSGLKNVRAIIDFPSKFQTFVIRHRDVTDEFNKDIFVVPSVRAFV